MNTQPCVQIKKARQDDVEAAIRDIHGHSSQVLAQKGLTGQHLELLIIILPDMSGSYGKLFKWILKLITLHSLFQSSIIVGILPNMCRND